MRFVGTRQGMPCLYRTTQCITNTKYCVCGDAQIGRLYLRFVIRLYIFTSFGDALHMPYSGGLFAKGIGAFV